jgi:hypothetical protein
VADPQPCKRFWESSPATMAAKRVLEVVGRVSCGEASKTCRNPSCQEMPCTTKGRGPQVLGAAKAWLPLG